MNIHELFEIVGELVVAATVVSHALHGLAKVLDKVAGMTANKWDNGLAAWAVLWTDRLSHGLDWLGRASGSAGVKGLGSKR